MEISDETLIPSDEPAAAKCAAAAISGPAKGAPVPAASNKTAPSEINLGRFRILSAQIVQQCGDTLMIALDCCARPMQLQDSR